MSDNAIVLLFWANAYRNTRIADYENWYEMECARRWAAYIFNDGKHPD
jgi:hypothetical protein